jgi:hypothetical protein
MTRYTLEHVNITMNFHDFDIRLNGLPGHRPCISSANLVISLAACDCGSMCMFSRLPAYQLRGQS